MRLGLGLGVNSITSQKIGAGFTGILDEYSGAAAAYSVRRLSSTYTDGLIRVRRSSDDTEQDIGFDSNGDLDTTALTTFVNADVNQYTSDFSSTEDLSEFNGTGAAAQSVGGVDDAYKFTLSGGSGNHFAYRNIHEVGQSHEVSFDVYIPSSNSAVDGVLFSLFGAQDIVSTSTTDEWVTLTATYSANYANGNFFATDGGSKTVNGDGDVFYLKNIVVTQTTADGAVTTFYDQSGNGNNATNATESEQPLIVSAGSLTQLNSKAAINGDGADDVLSVSTGVDLSSGYSIFHVSQVPSANTYGITLSNSAGNDRNLIFDSIYRFQLDGTNNNNNGASGNRGAQYLWSLVNDSSGNLDMNRNGSAYGSQLTGLTGTFTFENIGTNIGVNSFEYFQELIIFNSDQSSNRGTVTTGGGTGIEGNINTYFNIV